ncbi:uncharacterized protein LOC144163893 [Haemaphysalis longicornis]
MCSQLFPRASSCHTPRYTPEVRLRTARMAGIQDSRPSTSSPRYLTWRCHERGWALKTRCGIEQRAALPLGCSIGLCFGLGEQQATTRQEGSHCCQHFLQARPHVPAHPGFCDPVPRWCEISIPISQAALKWVGGHNHP